MYGSVFALALAGLLLGQTLTTAQSSDAHDVETVTAAEVGPYRPEERPQLAQVERRVVELVNQFRRENDREPASTNATLKETAAEFAAYMARTGRYGHTADGRRPYERARAHDYEYCIVSENIAYQFRTTGFDTAELAKRFFEGWKNSPPHRKNMLDRDVTETGVAIAQSAETGVYYTVQMFGRPKSESIEFSITNPTEQAVRYRIEDETFLLPPRYTRTHTRCRPAEVELLAQPETDQGEPTVSDAIQPQHGGQFRVAADSGKQRFERTEGGGPQAGSQESSPVLKPEQ